MHIEIWQSSKESNVDGKNIGSWYWHKRSNNGRIVTDAEAFPTMANAVRAAKAEVRGTIKPCAEVLYVDFTSPKFIPKKQCWVIRWS